MVWRDISAPRLDVGEQPDYRFSLANERTFLAWIRTALALDAGGLAAFQLLPELTVPLAREIISLLLVLLGTAVAGSSFRRWMRNERALRTSTPLPPSRLPMLLTGGVLVVSVAAVVLLLLQAQQGG